MISAGTGVREVSSEVRAHLMREGEFNFSSFITFGIGVLFEVKQSCCKPDWASGWTMSFSKHAQCVFDTNTQANIQWKDNAIVSAVPLEEDEK